MGYLKYLRNAFLNPSEDQETLQRERLLELRGEPTTRRLERPTRIDRARTLGYRAKPGVLVVRQRVVRGQHTRPDIKSGRRPKRFHQRKNLSKNYQQIAEEKVGRRFVNCEVLGSYELAQDGKHTWYEVLLVDRRHPQVLADERLLGIAAQRGRAQRGVTGAGRRRRGLNHTGMGMEKSRPSLRANNRLR